MSVGDLDRYILITADTHAGADLRGYKPYLEKKWHDDFEAWAGAIESQREQMARMRGGMTIGVGGDPVADANRNWDSERRLQEMEGDGVVAEVIFPNTQPPFAPVSSLMFAPPPMGDDLERRWAGLQAHNRWLVDFCNEAPGRRAGIAQIFLPKIEESVKEIEWAKEQGLTGGV